MILSPAIGLSFGIVAPAIVFSCGYVATAFYFDDRNLTRQYFSLCKAGCIKSEPFFIL